MGMIFFLNVTSIQCFFFLVHIYIVTAFYVDEKFKEANSSKAEKNRVG